jgi:uncharacterized protein (DUF302 family)
MAYTFSKVVDTDFDETIEQVTEILKDSGFGVLTEIDVKATLKKKLDVDFRDYRILGACNPGYAYRALQAEDEIGSMLPCNVIVQRMPDGKIKVSAVDPIASMQAVDNPDLAGVAQEVRGLLTGVIDRL